ncbi:hypothetical protein AN958_06483 [Leucoagaricus sp. SymC.cos]|nr:hypothetical protein AN958_06483 [Leucoagaricus sp. SymC.cos]
MSPLIIEVVAVHLEAPRRATNYKFHAFPASALVMVVLYLCIGLDSLARR